MDRSARLVPGYLTLRLIPALLAMTLVAPAAGQPAGRVAPGTSRRPMVPRLNVEKYTLPNGLTVLLHVDRKLPVVAVDVWYKVGSRDEKPGRSGFAHLFEHLMFLGSQHHDRDFSLPLEKLGTESNATTSEDRTEYHETVPSDALELALWLEADRMGFLLPAMTRAKLDKERDVVKNERRETVDNVPYGQVDEATLRNLYPPGHPYHHSVIGSMADLSAASLEDVRGFFRTHYVPDRAVLCLAGDFRPDEARRWISKYFGPLPRGNAAPRARVGEEPVPKLPASKRVSFTDEVSLPRAYLVWPTVPAHHPDEAALDVLAAVLGGLDKQSRLFRALKYDRQLATIVTAEHPTKDLSGTFEVLLEPLPGHELDEVVTAARAELARLKREGPTESEVRKAQNQRESALIMGLQSVERKAAVLNQYEATKGDPNGFVEELGRVFDVTPADVRRVAGTYLGDAHLELRVVGGERAARPEEPAPAGNGSTATEPVAPPSSIRDDVDRSAIPRLGPAPRFSPPTFVRRRLSNGLDVLVSERHELPIVSFDLVLKSGETLAPPEKQGLASIAAHLLEEGTTSRTSLEIAAVLADLGATLEADAGMESTSVGLTTLTRHRDAALDLFRDVILNPAFPARELERLKLDRLAELEARKDDPEQVAAELFPRLVFGPDHPYGRPPDGTPASIASLSRRDVEAFHRRMFVPGNAALVVVGDVEAGTITAELERRLGSWNPGPTPPVLAPEPPKPPTAPSLYLVDNPGAPQSVLVVGKPGAKRSSPDQPALSVLNGILGGQFASRINLNLRAEKGYSYGAYSGFGFRRGAGPFQAGGSVQTGATGEALAELLKELGDISDRRPPTPDELAFARTRLIRGFPLKFETTFGVAGQLALLVAYGLPDDEFATYQARIERVSGADLDRVARQYITPRAMTILVVGDRARVEAPLRALAPIAAIRLIDAQGRPRSSPPAPR